MGRPAVHVGVLAALLVASGLVNVVFLLRPATDGPASVSQVSAAGPSSTRAAGRFQVGKGPGAPLFVRDACREELEVEQRDLESIRRLKDRLRHPTEVFESLSRQNPTLAATIREQLPPHLVRSIECRDLTCKVLLPPGANINTLTNTAGESGLGERIASMWPMWDHMFLVVRPEDEAFGADVLKSIVKALYDSPALTTCPERHPETGELYARLRVLPKDNPENDTNEARIIAMLHGGLAYGPLAECVGRELSSIIAAAAVPEKVSGAVFESVGLWPPSVQTRFRNFVLNVASSGPR
jgi:hypothetical protein